MIIPTREVLVETIRLTTFELDKARTERDAAIKERDTALTEAESKLGEVRAQRDGYRAAHEKALAEATGLRRDLDRALEQLEAVCEDRNRLIDESRFRKDVAQALQKVREEQAVLAPYWRASYSGPRHPAQELARVLGCSLRRAFDLYRAGWRPA